MHKINSIGIEMFENSFFLIDNNNIHSCVNKIYGYAIFDDDIIVNDTIPEYLSFDDNLFNLGVYISKHNNNITISTDNNGMGIIFYYVDDSGYFAISNSFYKIFQHLSDTKTLTADLDYLTLFNSVKEITTFSHTNTPINEIKILPQNDSITVINNKLIINKGKLVSLINLDSKQGLEYVDKWADTWINLLKVLTKKNKNINIQLSGGFDSRVIFALAIKSGIDLSKINIESSLGMKNDLDIATDIAKFYGVKLNDKLSTWSKKRITSESEFELNKLSRIGLHKEFLPAPFYYKHKTEMFQFSGWGEVRDRGVGDKDKFIESMFNNLNCKKNDIVKDRLKRIINKTCSEISQIFDSTVDPDENFLNFAYNYTRARWNFGTTLQAACSMNQIILTPIFGLTKLNPISANNSDFNLVYTYIYHRFAPELLNFKFTGNREIQKETIRKAVEMNKTPYSYNYKTPSNLNIKSRLSVELQNIADYSEYNNFISSDSIEKAMQNINNKEIRHPEKEAFGLLSLSYVIEGTKKSIS